MENPDILAAFIEFQRAAGPGCASLTITDSGAEPGKYPVLRFAWEPAAQSRGMLASWVLWPEIARFSDPLDGLLREATRIGSQMAKEHARHLETVRPVPA